MLQLICQLIGAAIFGMYIGRIIERHRSNTKILKEVHMEIEFPAGHDTMYLGRNGLGICKGLSVQRWKTGNSQPYITLAPINSKKNLARCYIEVPEITVPQISMALSCNYIGMILDRLGDRITGLLGIHPVIDNEIQMRLKKE